MSNVRIPWKDVVTAKARKIRHDDIRMLAALYAEFDVEDLSLEARKLHERVLADEKYRQQFRDALIAYFSQTVGDACYEARLMNAFLGLDTVTSFGSG